jgi:16S rRNA pseudouridine516 synthase
MMNKQDQCVTAVVDAQYRTVMDVLKQSSVYRPEMEHHVRPVGRLDMNTTGLLLFTDDGDLHRRVLLPEHHVPKRYLCTLRDEACAADVEAFANGVVWFLVHISILSNQYCESDSDDASQTIALPHEKERVCQPAWSRIDPTNARSVELEIGEGANHQVKRMWQLRGNKVVELKRISMGSLQLDPCLAPGEVRHLTVDEARLLYASAQFSHSFFATCIPPPDA